MTESSCFLEAFCGLLGCSQTKLQFVANVGFFIMCPHRKQLHLQKGWEGTWSYLSTVASAITYHGDQWIHLAALIFVHQKCMVDNNKWLWFLQSEDLEEGRTDKKCSELPGIVTGIAPLVRCPPVEERIFSDWECLTMFSLGWDTGQCVPQNVCWRDI